MSDTFVREEVLLGAVPSVVPDGSAHEWTRTRYERSLIDGWRRRTDHWQDGITWAYETVRRSHVRAVLDHARHVAECVTRAQLGWIDTLSAAGHHARASRQRQALRAALARHGLTRKPQPRSEQPRARPKQRHATSSTPETIQPLNHKLDAYAAER